MTFRTFACVILMIGLLQVVAADTPAPIFPEYAQKVLNRYDSQVDAAQHKYWEAIAAADNEKLKGLQEAMISAAKENNFDAIPIIKTAIDETKLKLAQDTAATGEPASPGKMAVVRLATYIGGDGKPGAFLKEGEKWYEFATNGDIYEYVEIPNTKTPGSVALYDTHRKCYAVLETSGAFSSDASLTPLRKFYNIYWRK